ncbi:MAG: LptF/LptG family permease, partial [Muribaculaceae bacterium]|nr:LptF/LptG family permease [Muribaculaceae bacterium]
GAGGSSDRMRHLARAAEAERQEAAAQAVAEPLNLDSLIEALPASQRDGIFASAANMVRMRATELEFRAMQISDEKGRERRNRIELIKKFTLSVACIIFLFIGAPLGAIIRKGGLGTPLVISVLLFLVYYIIDNTGYKMARDGHWVVWCGMWLSTFVLLPLGIFVTYKAMNDSAVFNPDIYREFIRRILGLREKRHVALKDVIINDIDPAVADGLRGRALVLAEEWLAAHRERPGYGEYWRGAYCAGPLRELDEAVDAYEHYMSDSPDPRVIDRLNRLPVARPLWLLCPAKRPRMRAVLKWLPVGPLLWLAALPYARRTRNEVTAVRDELRCSD